MFVKIFLVLSYTPLQCLQLLAFKDLHANIANTPTSFTMQLKRMQIITNHCVCKHTIKQAY